jgi:hypothetical protein
MRGYDNDYAPVGNETMRTSDDMSSPGAKNIRLMSDEQILLAIVEQLVTRATNDAKFRQMMGLDLREGKVVHIWNEREVGVVDAEQMCCEAGYRPMQKTCSSRISRNPIGYNRYSYPSLGHEFSVVTEEDARRAMSRHAAFLSQQRGVGLGVREHVIGPLPHCSYRLVTEETDDAFDSGDESLEQARASTEQGSSMHQKVESKTNKKRSTPQRTCKQTLSDEPGIDLTQATGAEHTDPGGTSEMEFRKVRKVIHDHMERESLKRMRFSDYRAV